MKRIFLQSGTRRRCRWAFTSRIWKWTAVLFVAASFAAGLWITELARANGGPFVVKYPGGDPAAKGVLARLAPDLLPAQESRLAVIKEDLSISFEPDEVAIRATRTTRGDVSKAKDSLIGDPLAANAAKPANRSVSSLVAVTAAYLITNTTTDSVEIDFGFPVLRGIYLTTGMMPTPAAQVTVDDFTVIRPVLISNSAIYGTLRRRAQETIDRALQNDHKLQTLALAVTQEKPSSNLAARDALKHYLVGKRKWSEREAALFVVYASLRPDTNATMAGGTTPSRVTPVPVPGMVFWPSDKSVVEATRETAWATCRIGEQKATQWLTCLAKRLDPSTANSYEAVFAAWGGDVRERSVDMLTGSIRPRQISAESGLAPTDRRLPVRDSDQTVYARVDYLDPRANLAPDQKAAWESVVQNLPVVFTFAPMNLLYYRVGFAPQSTRTVKVTYRQFAYLDTASPESYQIAYVLHPASLWKSFGPINLTVEVPEGVVPVSSVPLKRYHVIANPNHVGGFAADFVLYSSVVTQKTDELFVGINADQWDDALRAGMPGMPRLLSASPTVRK